MNSEIDKDKTNGKTDEIDEIIQRSILEEFEIFVDDLRLKYKLTEDEVCSIIKEDIEEREDEVELAKQSAELGRLDGEDEYTVGEILDTYSELWKGMNL